MVAETRAARGVDDLTRKFFECQSERALLLAVAPRLSEAEVEQVLESTASPISTPLSRHLKPTSL
jgi:hypothetical protein